MNAYRSAMRRIVPHRTVTRRSASRRIASFRIAAQRNAPLRRASRRSAAQRNASRRNAPRRVVPQRNVLTIDRKTPMKIATATLHSISPYSQSRYHNTPKDQKETAKDYEQRTWRERVHCNGDGRIYIPPMTFKNCAAETAKYLGMQIPGKGKNTYTKHFDAGVLCAEPLVLPETKETVLGEWLFLNSDGRRGGGKRVEKCYPLIPSWNGDVVFNILDEAITQDVFRFHLEQSGAFIGIGRFRPRNGGFYGRFKVDNLQWKDA
jgi:hypothetical protein